MVCSLSADSTTEIERNKVLANRLEELEERYAIHARTCQVSDIQIE